MIINGDCLIELKKFSDNSVDSIVTDPPYGLRFMGKKWDYDVPTTELFRECLRVLKPGGHALVACGTRTQHRMALNIEDAGFEIRDVITWLYGSGFPKSLDISKAIDKSLGKEDERPISHPNPSKRPNAYVGQNGWETPQRPEFKTTGATDEAKQWQGFGTALKPACEFWTLARKPLSESTVAKNVLKYGTGGINVDGCRVGSDTIEKGRAGRKNNVEYGSVGYFEGLKGQDEKQTQEVRFPANLILDEIAGEMLDAQSGISKSQGGASRFFYCAKASKSERNAGLDGMPEKICWSLDGNVDHEHGNRKIGARPDLPTAKAQNFHPTVKPIKLMRYLVRLITPPNGLVLDPFAGSGSTGVAAIKENFQFIGIEREEEYCEIAKKRIESIDQHQELLL